MSDTYPGIDQDAIDLGTTEDALEEYTRDMPRDEEGRPMFSWADAETYFTERAFFAAEELADRAAGVNPR